MIGETPRRSDKDPSRDHRHPHRAGRFDRVKFTLEVDLDALPEGVDTPDLPTELARILRYWAGSMKHYELVEGDGSAIYNSAYREVGVWRVG